MALHKLFVEDFDEDSFLLLAIHCTLEDYRVAYLLNKQLKINLKRKPHNLDYKYTSASYSIYEWENTNQQVTWNLVSNICRKEEDSLSSSGGLFNGKEKIIRTHNLIPEYKKVNYLLKINNENYQISEKKIIDDIQDIQQIATVYSIDANELKSKDNLIFN
ncbi:IPExxxVDY family protein [Yeosuana sp. MJ-SS3]|uniref:IPExxxVDY family protein n=1 Tax=Gilvirhabdus luticola TaxID=3079858 RepID=A0ABU3U352_9FLAO|nr:IPExxxVDY family protein [Yeosuana sp. MJ-SS3]MDU8884771.1 IPExxxVDY family protein [Yeosuana sp. MJ-SS3]